MRGARGFYKAGVIVRYTGARLGYTATSFLSKQTLNLGGLRTSLQWRKMFGYTLRIRGKGAGSPGKTAMIRTLFFKKISTFASVSLLKGDMICSDPADPGHVNLVMNRGRTILDIVQFLVHLKSLR